MIKSKKIKLRYVTDKNGKKRDVILSIKDFEELMEDLSDLAIAAQRRSEETVAHSRVIKKLKADGAL
ncbi:MAG: hypothetical protein HYS25_16190 [Ignavibacteriales bacterium]|nr:hypothetical protein [Ignavibacteriales bacterium]